MNSSFRRIMALAGVTVLALALTLLLSSGDGARAMLQTSPLDSPIFEPSAMPTSDIFAPPDVEAPTLVAPTSIPLPAAVLGTPTPRGFLPAPTIVNPNDLQSLSLAQPPVSGVGSLAPTPLPTAVPANASLRAAVSLLNAVWLLCGGILLIAGAVAILWIWRRGQQQG